jgi:hypothetical protein
MGIWESSRTPETSKFDRRGQNTLHWSVLYTIGKLSKCRCRKWARMSHLDICSISYGKKKGRDSRPLKVENRPDPGPWCVQGECDTLLESSQQELHFCFRPRPNQRYEKIVIVAEVQTVAVLGLLLRSPRTKSHSDVGAMGRHKKYYMGEGGGFLWIQAVVSLVSPKLPVACSNTKGAPEIWLTNLLFGLMQVRVSN